MSFKFGNRFNNGGFSVSKSSGSMVTGSTLGNSEKVEASMNRYLPNNESLDSSSLLDEIIPQNEDGQLRVFRNIAKTDAVGGPAIDMLSSFPWSEGSLTGISDKEILSYYEDSFNMIDPQTYMPQATASYLTDGKIVSSLIYDSDKGSFTDIIPQDPMYLSFEPIPVKGFEPKVNYKGNTNFKKFFKSTDPRDSLARSRVSSDLAAKLAVGGNAPLEPLNTLYVPRVTNPFDWLGTSMLWRILPFYAIEKALWNASIANARRRARSITHIKVGIQDYWEPTQPELDSIGNLFMQSEEDPVGAYVVTRNGIETQDVRQANDFWKLSEEWDMLTSGKTRALGLSEALMSAETSLATAEQGMIIFIESIKVMRAELTNRIFYRKLFANIARAHGFVKKSTFESTASALGRMDEKFKKLCKEYVVKGSANGSGVYTSVGSGLTVEQAYDISYKDLLIPEINWRKQLTPPRDSTYTDMLTLLEEKGVPISKKQWAATAGLDIDKQIQSMEEDATITKVIQDNLTKSGVKSEDGEESGGEDDEDFSFASTSKIPIKGVAEVFDNLSKSPRKKTFFGIGVRKLRKATEALTKDNNFKILDDTSAVKRVLSELYEGNYNKINAACYLLNRAYITDVKIGKKFLGKIANRINDRLKDNKDGQSIRNLTKERNYVYSECAKYSKNKPTINIPSYKDVPDKLTGKYIYSGIPQ